MEVAPAGVAAVVLAAGRGVVILDPHPLPRLALHCPQETHGRAVLAKQDNARPHGGRCAGRAAPLRHSHSVLEELGCVESREQGTTAFNTAGRVKGWRDWRRGGGGGCHPGGRLQAC